MHTQAPSDIFLLSDFEQSLPHHEMCWVAGGSFLMGAAADDTESDDDEKPQHLVTMGAYAIAKYPVTQGLYKAVMGDTIGDLPCGFLGDARPMERISWEECIQFIKLLNEETNRINSSWKYRLPSEAQWEYAARGGAASAALHFKYAGSNKLKEVAWFDGNSHSETKEVGKKAPNPLGIHDMTGNVWEWCQDHWHDNYKGAPDDGSAWEDREEGSHRVRRGGSWGDHLRGCRVAYRDSYHPAFRSFNVGFRLVLCP